MKILLIILLSFISFSIRAQDFSFIWKFDNNSLSPNQINSEAFSGSISNINRVNNHGNSLLTDNSSFYDSNSPYHICASVNQFNEDLNSNTYFEFSIKHSYIDSFIRLKNINLVNRVTNTGPTTLKIVATTTHQEISLGSIVLNNNSVWNNVQIPISQNFDSDSINIKLYLFGATLGSQVSTNFRADDIVLDFQVVNKSALPINIAYFKNNMINNLPYISWRLNQEVPSYTLESSIDGKHFKSVMYFQHTDIEVDYDILSYSERYYRLKFEFPEEIYYSQTLYTLVVQYNVQPAVLFSQNSLEIINCKDCESITLNNLQGQTWHYKIDSENKLIDVNTLNSGIYIYTIQQQQRYFVDKLFKP